MRWIDYNFGLALMVLYIELSKEFDSFNIKSFYLIELPGFEKNNTAHYKLLSLFNSSIVFLSF